MAKVIAPLLSFSASGKIANTLVAFGWKGIQVMRKYVVPSNPNTKAQKDQRDLLKLLVSIWRSHFTNAATRTAWNKTALTLKETMSGFNAYMRNAIGIALDNPDGSFASAITPTAGRKATFAMLNLDDGATGDETGDFEIWAGSDPQSLMLIEEIAIATGNVVGATALGDAGDVVFLKLRKDLFDRSGIYQITLITA